MFALKENIYTIPINEVFDMDCECALCEFIKNEEIKRIDYSLGASMMEPDERIKSNELGYCQRHTQMMYHHGNKLSHALVLETRLDNLIESIDNLNESLKRVKPAGLFSKCSKNNISDFKEFRKVSLASDTCVICKRLDEIMEAFVNNLFYMYKKDDEFKNKFFSSKGFCISHFNLLAKKALELLNNDECVTFLKELCKLETEHLKRVRDDVNWFTKKFDYRFKDAEWKNSKDAVQRGSLKISGYIND